MALQFLSVDDSRVIRALVKKAFKPFDVAITEAENGAEGLVKAAAAVPDLIILDVAMPVMTGIEMLERLKTDEKLKAVPVIMLTAEANKKEVMKILQLGASSYLLKPFKSDQLLERVGQFVSLAEKPSPGPEELFSEMVSESEGVTVISAPEKISRVELLSLEKGLPNAIRAMLSAKKNAAVIDLRKCREVNISLIKFMGGIRRQARDVNIRTELLCTPDLARSLRNLEETKNIPLHFKIEAAIGALNS
ncbi:hypothetical protein CSB20_04235 [bacterium DOLZORAL124_64_63]|nr:MAG: hypothetical protein CSB20_04235 [bacterium DOLZORAL124_64_63]